MWAWLRDGEAYLREGSIFWHIKNLHYAFMLGPRYCALLLHYYPMIVEPTNIVLVRKTCSFGPGAGALHACCVVHLFPGIKNKPERPTPVLSHIMCHIPLSHIMCHIPRHNHQRKAICAHCQFTNKGFGWQEVWLVAWSHDVLSNARNKAQWMIEFVLVV